MKLMAFLTSLFASSALAQNGQEAVLPMDKSFWPLQSQVALERYGWLDALSVSLRSILDPSVLMDQSLVSAIPVADIARQHDNVALLEFLKGSGLDWSEVEYTATGYAIAQPDENMIYSIAEIKCRDIDCAVGDLQNLTSWDDLPERSVLVSGDRSGLDQLGGDVFLAEPR